MAHQDAVVEFAQVQDVVQGGCLRVFVLVSVVVAAAVVLSAVAAVAGRPRFRFAVDAGPGRGDGPF
jgi:hypothetical protein